MKRSNRAGTDKQGRKKALMTASVASMIDLFSMENIYLLQRLGYEVEVAANFSFGSITSAKRVKEFQRELMQKNIPVYDIPIPRRITDTSDMHKAYQMLRKLFMQNHYQLVHAQSPTGGALVRLAAAKNRKNGTRVLYTAHGFHFYQGAPLWNWLVYYTVEKWLARYTDTLITINAEDFKRAKKFRAGQVCYVPGIGVDLEKFQPSQEKREQLRQAFGFRRQDFVVINVGQLSKRKNQETLIRAMALISNTNIRCLLVGDGECRKKDEALIAELGLKKKVRMAGYQQDVCEILQMADCFVFPSLQEGLPAALMEAMAAGVPVVCSRIRGNRDLIRDGTDGMLVEPCDEKGLADAIIQMHAYPQLADKYRKNAKKRIGQFSRERVNRRMEQIYRAQRCGPGDVMDILPAGPEAADRGGLDRQTETAQESVKVVLAANKKYVPVLYTCVQSVMEHRTAGRCYCVYILHTDIPGKVREVFQKHLADTGAAIQFINVKNRVSGYVLKAKQHISAETFYRFLILDLFKEVPKAVYLDCDLIVRRDIAKLYDTPMEQYCIAAARDPDFIGQCGRRQSDMAAYCKKVLGISNPSAYFQAGVLVLHIEKLRRTVSVPELMEMAGTGIYRFSDQDILNLVCKGKVKYLDMRWNVLSDCGHIRWQEAVRHAPYAVREEYVRARKEPYIIHYAGFLKPWMKPDEDFGYEFWKAARKTVFYEQLLAGMQKKPSKEMLKYKMKRILSKVKRRLGK